MGEKIKALRAAFPHTLPILTGYLALGAAYGVLLALRSGDSTHFFVSSIIRISSFRVSVRTTSVTTSTALS